MRIITAKELYPLILQLDAIRVLEATLFAHITCHNCVNKCLFVRIRLQQIAYLIGFGFAHDRKAKLIEHLRFAHIWLYRCNTQLLMYLLVSSIF